MIDKDDLLKIIPMGEYEAPELPTLEEGRSDLLKKIPHRWKHKVVIAIAAGLLVAGMMVGCATTQTTETISTDTDVSTAIASPISMENFYCSDLHTVESGAPVYVAYLTEQEIFGMIRNQLEEAGLTLSELSSPLRVTINDVYAELESEDEDHSTFRAIEDDIYLHFIVEEAEMGIVVIPN